MSQPPSSALILALDGFGVSPRDRCPFYEGKMVMGEFASQGGDAVSVILDLHQGVLCCGILNIHNLSGQAYRDFLKFRRQSLQWPGR